MKKKLFLFSCAFATVLGANTQNAYKVKSTPRVSHHSDKALISVDANHITYSKEEYTVKTNAKTRGTSTVTDTLSLVDYRKQYGRPGRWVNSNGTWSYNGLNSGVKLKQYPTYQSTTGQKDNLGMIIKFPTKQATKIKGAGVVLAALNSAGSTVDVNFYGKKTAGGQMEFLGTVQKTIPASASYANVWFNLPTPVNAVDTFDIEVSPASAKDSIIVNTTGVLGVNQAKFKGSISGTTLTANLTSGGIANALEIVGTGVTPGTKILYQSGYNTWVVDKSQTVASIAAPIDMTQNPIAFDDAKTLFMVYQTNSQGTVLEDQYLSYIAYDGANQKPYALDAYVYPVVEYTWNTVAPTVTASGATATAVSTLSGYTTDLLFSRAAFFKKYWATAGKSNNEYYSILNSVKTGKKDTLDNTTNLTTTYSYTSCVTDTIYANEVMRGYGFAKRPVYSSNLSTVIFSNKPAVPTFTGASAVCIGSTINLVPSVAGGTWTSSNVANATVTSGAVKGIAAGTATISYKVGSTNCNSTGTRVITVEAAPVVTLSGSYKICALGRAIMKASVTGGVWGVENSALLVTSQQGLFRNPTTPATDNFKTGINYTLTSKLKACTTKVVKPLIVRNVAGPTVTVTAPKTGIKVNETVTATATTTMPATGVWSSLTTLVSATRNTLNTKTAAIKGLKVGTNANIIYYADDAATGCRPLNWLTFSVTAASSLVDANQGSISSTTGMNVYPNPSNGVVTFENIAGAKSISLVDMTGRTVKSVAVNADRMTVDFSGIQNGKYLVQVAGENVNEVKSIVIE
jgi:Secretion system C-terminal sorting domain